MANNKKKRDYRSGVTPQFLADRTANLVDAVTSIPKEIKEAYGKYQKNKAEEEARKAIAKTRYKGQDEDEKKLREAKKELRLAKQDVKNFPQDSKAKAFVDIIQKQKVDKWTKKILENKHRHGRGQKPYKPTKEQEVRKKYLDRIKMFQETMRTIKERVDRNPNRKLSEVSEYKKVQKKIDDLRATERREWLIANRPTRIKDLERKSKENRATKKANRESKKNSGASSLRKYDKITKISR
tara:strand:- start:23 stop:742 length:720 start_codon:yes stop_codon:yes gene_type:complete